MRHRSLNSLTLLLATSCAGTPVAELSHPESSQLFDLLDTGRDGSLSPFEALDALLVISKEGVLTRDTLGAFLSEYAEEELADRRDFFEMGDLDRDGRLLLDELPSGFASMMSSLDTDGDGAITWSEFQLADIESSELMARGEGAELYAEFVEEIGDPVRLKGAPPDFVEELREFDLDRDGIVAQGEIVQVIREELAGATFEVTGELAIMRGVIGARTPSSVLELAFMNPEVRTIVLTNMPGSIDDVANVRAGRYIRQLGLGTHVPADGEVASGATDLFLAGKHRSAEPGARFGIHSWGGGPVVATDLPKDHEDHLLYLDYYEEMGIPGEFYWRTLSAAPAEGIHWMTEEELERFGFFTDHPAYLK
jgi:Ca2+-binding EF-hand superfamily protein